MIASLIKKGLYFDSVTLMNVARKLSETEGVLEAAVVMGTKENKEILAAAGLLAEEFSAAGGSDLLIAIKTAGETIAAAVLKEAEAFLENVRKKTESAERYFPGSIEDSVKLLPGANLALISLAGRYAAREAKKALENNLHVMLFSDNVSLEDEIELKKFARQKNLLMMGPDCGTAIINGVPLGFANAVKRGNIGIVAAAGTGLQEVSCIISNEGGGISQALGAGGRDVKKAVGGLMFGEALNALAGDEATQVLLLVSKPPDEAALVLLAECLKNVDKPVVAVFLGANKLWKAANLPKVRQASTLEEAALLAAAFSRGENPGAVTRRLKTRHREIQDLAGKEAKKMKKGQKYIRGLFSGGTLCAEAQVILAKMVSGLYSNVPLGKVGKLPDAQQSRQHTLLDLGEDEFTIGRPHPMIDFSLRNRRILKEANDPETAIILLDVVLGYGAHENPAGELFAAIRSASQNALVICSVTGTEKDPQNRRQTITSLKNAGAMVVETNAAASLLAGSIAKYANALKIN